MNIWLLIGIGLLVWVLHDLYYGVTWIHRPIYRKYEPLTYWFVQIIWLIIAISTLINGIN